LREIPDPPLALQVRGGLPSGPAVAIVGSRRPSRCARDMARALGFAASRAGASVVSGLAYGVDAAAHAGALEGGGATIAVLASGLDRATPYGQRGLARRILEEGGAWVSEHPPGTDPRPYYFPVRNRLISGLVPLSVIVEARDRSGSLWTASHAADQSRDVAAVPGPVDSERCRGSNRLLRDGAAAILEPADLLVALELSDVPAPLTRTDSALSSLGPGARRVLLALGDGPAELDALARRLELHPGALQSALLELELAGLALRDGSVVAARAGIRARPPARAER
jgi:DNA processing protein